MVCQHLKQKLERHQPKFHARQLSLRTATTSECVSTEYFQELATSAKRPKLLQSFQKCDCINAKKFNVSI